MASSDFWMNGWVWLAVSLAGFGLCAFVPVWVRNEHTLKILTKWLLVPISLVLICYAYPVGLEMFRRLALSF